MIKSPEIVIDVAYWEKRKVLLINVKNTTLWPLSLVSLCDENMTDLVYTGEEKTNNIQELN